MRVSSFPGQANTIALLFEVGKSYPEDANTETTETAKVLAIGTLVDGKTPALFYAITPPSNAPASKDVDAAQKLSVDGDPNTKLGLADLLTFAKSYGDPTKF